MRPVSYSQLSQAEREAIDDQVIIEVGVETSWNPKTRSFRCYSESWGGHFPKRVHIKSDKTGVVAVFVRDEDAALANEFWDGELCEYINTELKAKVVVAHAY